MAHADPRTRPNLRELLDTRIGGLPSWVVLIELFIGLGWLRAATEKIIDPHWWNGSVLESFLAEHSAQTLPWYVPIADNIVGENLVVIALVVVIAQLVAGALLVFGYRPLLGLGIGVFLNINFVAAGAVNPSIFYLVCQAALVLWLLENRVQPERAISILGWIGAISVAAIVVSVPFGSTIQPAEIIDDPAMILGFFGALALVTAGSERRQLRADALSQRYRTAERSAPARRPTRF